MKQILSLTIGVILLIACNIEKGEQEQASFSSQKLLWRLEVLAHDSLEGRGFGTSGNTMARKFLVQQFSELGISPAAANGYEQPFEHTLSKRRRQRMFPVANPGKDLENVNDITLTGGNVIAKVPGESEKMIVVTAHLDHLGVRNGEIFNGADDDASGTAALVSIAEYFSQAKPYHTLIIAAVDAEEIGSPGCQYLVDNFPGELTDVVFNVNMDMIAHNDNNELWACGTYHYPQLKDPLQQLNSDITLRFGHDNPNDSTLDDWTRSSDHRIFHDKEIPFIYFGVEDHADYHRPSDTFENINQEFYIDAVELVIRAIESLDANFRPAN
jgi:hypothetical protein